MTVLEINDSTYVDEVINHKGFVVVEFTSPQCGCCNNIKSNVEYTARTHKDTIKIVRVNCLTDNENALKEGVQGYPHYLMYRDGQKVNEYRGAPVSLDIETIILRVYQNQSIKGY